ncbi:MAG: hypothetical protein GXO21_05220, partial [Aquificae bacterium]|nr:hypothetical protein [Aquificota bacterium]
MLNFIFYFLFFCFTFSYGGEIFYQFGRGLYIKNNFWLGGYFSLNFWKRGDKHTFKFEDIALLSRVNYKKVSLFSEIEAKGVFVSSNTEKNCNWNLDLQIERLYFEYNHSRNLNLKLGRFLTPLGIWNKIHIDALKWTVSDPLVSRKFFPMFTTGIELYGFLPSIKNFKYEVFVQKNKGINDSYNNLQPRNMFGLQIEKIFNINKKLGFNLGRFDEEITNERYTFLGLYGKTKFKKL